MPSFLKIDDELSLTYISLDYGQDIFEGFDQDVIEFLPVNEPPARIEDTLSFVKNSLKQIENGTDLVWVILNRDKFIGCCGIHTIQSKQPHFGLWIKKSKQGKGYGKKVVDYMLHWGLNNLNIDFLKYPVDKRNIKSIKLLNGHNAIVAAQYVMGEQKKLDVIEYHLYRN